MVRNGDGLGLELMGAGLGDGGGLLGSELEGDAEAADSASAEIASLAGADDVGAAIEGRPGR